jgi:tripartite-type tricarboxylate transporter receptor subunit TctC
MAPRPDVPTTDEVGLPGSIFPIDMKSGLQRGTRSEIIGKLNAAYFAKEST